MCHAFHALARGATSRDTAKRVESQRFHTCTRRLIEKRRCAQKSFIFAAICRAILRRRNRRDPASHDIIQTRVVRRAGLHDRGSTKIRAGTRRPAIRNG
jgi:hypothetical protein